jgi:hypothetical protein
MSNKSPYRQDGTGFLLLSKWELKREADGQAADVVEHLHHGIRHFPMGFEEAADFEISDAPSRAFHLNRRNIQIRSNFVKW